MGKRHRGHRGSGRPGPDASGPVRTCCGCGEQAGQADLVRLAIAADGTLCVDLRGKLGGRGAWIHPRQACVAGVESRPGSLGRSLRTRPATAGLAQQLHDAVSQAALDGLSMAAAAGLLIGGRDLLTRALRDRKVVGVVVACDASERTVDEFRSAADEDVAFTQLPLDVAALGARVGKGPRAALGIRPSTAAAHLLRQLRRLRDLG